MAREIPLTLGLVALVDEDDFGPLSQWEWIATRSATGAKFYVQRKGCSELMHRVVIGAEKGQLVDHVNGDTLDNRRSNLRFCSRAQNSYNRGPSSNNSSGYKGVSATPKRWQACIQIDRKKRFLGCFDTPEEAARAYDEAAREFHGEFARLNFPDLEEAA
jgi:hypothetical protein